MVTTRRPTRKPQLYGLHFRVDSVHGTRWVRLFPRLAFHKPAAVRVFQDWLIELSFRGKTPELRPVK